MIKHYRTDTRMKAALITSLLVGLVLLQCVECATDNTTVSNTVTNPSQPGSLSNVDTNPSQPGSLSNVDTNPSQPGSHGTPDSGADSVNFQYGVSLFVSSVVAVFSYFV